MDSKTSQRILELAKDQQEELELQEDEIAEPDHASEFVLPRVQLSDSWDDDDGMGESENEVADEDDLFVSSYLSIVIPLSMDLFCSK